MDVNQLPGATKDHLLPASPTLPPAARGSGDLPSVAAAPGASSAGGSLRDVMASPWLWTAAILLAFYQFIPHSPVWRETLLRYFSSHPLEYAETALFVLGMSILGKKLIRLRRERDALRVELFSEQEPGEGADSLSKAEQLRIGIQSAPEPYRRTWWFQRMLDTCHFVHRRGCGDGLEEELKYLSDQAHQRLHDSYSLMQTITWAIPIMGFLGTVMGVTLAIANITPDQLDSSLNDVTGGLAVAFDTTALALSLSLLLVFAYFFVKRNEEALLNDVDDLAMRHLAPALVEPSTRQRTLIEAEAEAAQLLVRNTESLLKRHVELWDESLTGLRDRWDETLHHQQSELSQSLVDGVSFSLDEHRRLVDELQHKVVAAFDTCSQTLVEQLDQVEERRQQHDLALAETIQNMGRELQTRLFETHAEFEQRQLAMAESLAERLSGWQERLQTATQAVEQQMGLIVRQGELLTQMLEQEEHLVRLQDKLNDNLEAVRAAATFEETLHQLTAAVHLLTTRARPWAA